MTTETQKSFPTDINLQHESMQILKTVLLLDRPYSAAYISRILIGDNRFDLRKVSHKDLETFGALDAHSRFRLEDIIYYLTEEQLLEVTDPQYGTLKITDSGTQWLDNPQNMIVMRKEIFTGWWGFELLLAVRSIRKEAADRLGKQAYELFTNYTIACMIHQLPQDEQSLNALPGISQLEQAVKLLLLTAINQIVEKKEEDAVSGIHSKANSPSHRKVKDLYESGFSLEEIAERRKLQTTTVRKYLFTLHEAGKLDLNPWIEQQLDPKILYKGAEYFRSVDDRRLKPAHEVLGIDYDTLALCRHYAEKVGEPAMRYAS
ncbi:MAG: RQC domain-containing protein [Bacteroidota bacterium]